FHMQLHVTKLFPGLDRAGLGRDHEFAIAHRPIGRTSIDALPIRQVVAVEQNKGVRGWLADGGGGSDPGGNRRPNLSQFRLYIRVVHLGNSHGRDQQEKRKKPLHRGSDSRTGLILILRYQISANSAWNSILPSV